MVKLVIGHRVGNAVTDGAAGHIQSLDAPVQQPDKLKPADTGILTGILSKALALPDCPFWYHHAVPKYQ
jgi:hypothetical protein